MQVTFVETMRGQITVAGEEQEIRFSVVAAAKSPWRLLRTGEVALRGLVRAPAWAREAEARGSLRLSPRRLHYELRFRGDDGEELLLTGVKHPRLSAPLGSMTVMTATLTTDSGRLLGRGTLRFAVADLPPFLWSWLPFGKGQQRRLDAERRTVARRELDREGAA
jgi:hypothetical protein